MKINVLIDVTDTEGYSTKSVASAELKVSHDDEATIRRAMNDAVEEIREKVETQLRKVEKAKREADEAASLANLESAGY